MKKSVLKDIKEIILKNDFTTNVQILFATKSAGVGFDDEEKNYTYTSLAPVTIKALVRDLTPNSLITREFGLNAIGSIQICTLDKYIDWFKKCRKLIIDQQEYVPYRLGVGNKNLIQHNRSGGMITVVAERK